MPDDAAPSVLRRMLKPAPNAVSGAAVTEARAWRMSLPRSSEQAAGLVAGVAGLDVTETDLDAVLEGWDAFVLALALAGPDQARGFALIDAELRAGLIEVQTLGRVQRIAVPDRKATIVDGALARHVIDAWITGFEAASGADDAGWRCGALIADERAAKMAVDDGEYRVEDITVSLGEGARTGRLRLVTPFGAPVAQPGAPRREDRSALYAVEADVNAILCRMEVPWRWLADLAPGAILEVPMEALTRVRIEDEDGRLVTRARLGKSQGMRALRLAGAAPGDDVVAAPGAARVVADHAGAVEAGMDGADVAMDPAADATADLPEPEPLAIEGLPTLDGLPPLEEGEEA